MFNWFHISISYQEITINTNSLFSPHIATNLQPICLGTAEWGAHADDNADELYATFRGAGGNVFDTAHCYAFWLGKEGASERTLGELVRRHDKREDVIIGSKGCHSTGGDAYPRPERYLTPELLARDLDESLRRLNTDYIDIYYLHRDDTAVPVDEILDALQSHQNAGRIRHYAASNWRAKRLQQAHEYAMRKALSGFRASQILWNLGELSQPLAPDMCAMDETEMRYYQAASLTLFAYSSTANGYFARGDAGSYSNAISHARRERAWKLAQKRGATANQIALAWLLHHDFPTVAVVGTRDNSHLRDALGATQIELSLEEVRWLRDG